MKLHHTQIERMVRHVFESLKEKKLIVFKKSEKEVFDRACQLVSEDFKKEDALIHEVNKMLDDLERQNPDGFDRRKMFGLLKSRLAKQKGVVL